MESVPHGRSWQSRVCFSSLQALLAVVTRWDIPQPHVLEQGDHSVVWILHLSWGLIEIATGPKRCAAENKKV